MLSFEQIIEYFTPELARINPKGLIVEYLQYEFLDSIFKQAGSEHISFIGGTAIRIIYSSQRFSEDIDFDNFGLDYGNFKKLINNACREMKLKGFNIEYRFVKRGKHFHSYVKFPKIFAQFGITAHHQAKILLGIDLEAKEKLFAPEVRPINKFGVFRNIIVNPAPILLSQKLTAILFRKREKGRDFYDVSFLGGLAGPDFNYLKEITGLSMEEFKNKLMKRCQHFNYKALAEDVSPFLFDAGQKERILNFRNVIEEILGTS